MAEHHKPPIPTNSGYVESDKHQIAFAVYGSGTPLILVHGWGSDAQHNWVDSGWVATLEQQYTVITLDVRGHGRSDKPMALAPFSYAGMSRDVLAVLDALAIEQSGLLGYSMGAFMGAYLLGHYPERFSSMILGGIGNETKASAAQGSAIADALRATEFSKVTNPYGQQVRQFVASNPNNNLASLAYSALKMWPEGYPLIVAGDDIANAKLPVLMVNGANDHPYVDSADSIAAALPNASHLRIPSTDHMSVVSDKRFKQAAVDFFATHSKI